MSSEESKLTKCLFIEQLVKFNAALADNSANANPHLIDGIVLTKFDTIDDKVNQICSECFYFLTHQLKSNFGPYIPQKLVTCVFLKNNNNNF